jgi:hypothetical protein
MPNAVDDRRILPLRESASDVAVEEHIEQGGLTGPWFPTVFWDVENTENQQDQTRYLEADIADCVIWAIAGMVFRPTEGLYEGRQIEPDSSQILDLSLTQIPGRIYYQPDVSLFIVDQDGREITNTEEGWPSFFLNRLTGPMYLRDPFLIPNRKKLRLTIRFLRNAGVKGRLTLGFFGTLLYGGKATAR